MKNWNLMFFFVSSAFLGFRKMLLYRFLGGFVKPLNIVNEGNVSFHIFPSFFFATSNDGWF
jgi:hypothetical protein